MSIARLDSRALIRVTGPDARPFLHNLLTQDVETLEPGDVLEIKVDDGEPALNVPASLKAEGHKVLKKSRSGGVWTITARKAGK